jgi:hypothetical protein
MPYEAIADVSEQSLVSDNLSESESNQLQGFRDKIYALTYNLGRWEEVVHHLEIGQLESLNLAETTMGGVLMSAKFDPHWVFMLKPADFDVYVSVHEQLVRIMSSRKQTGKLSKLITFLRAHIEELDKELNTLVRENLALAQKFYLDTWNSGYTMTEDIFDVMLCDEFDSYERSCYLSGELDFVATHCDERVLKLLLDVPVPETACEMVKEMFKYVNVNFSTHGLKPQFTAYMRDVAQHHMYMLQYVGLDLVKSRNFELLMLSIEGMHASRTMITDFFRD